MFFLVGYMQLFNVQATKWMELKTLMSNEIELATKNPVNQWKKNLKLNTQDKTFAGKLCLHLTKLCNFRVLNQSSKINRSQQEFKAIH